MVPANPKLYSIASESEFSNSCKLIRGQGGGNQHRTESLIKAQENNSLYVECPGQRPIPWWEMMALVVFENMSTLFLSLQKHLCFKNSKLLILTHLPLSKMAGIKIRSTWENSKYRHTLDKHTWEQNQLGGLPEEKEERRHLICFWEQKINTIVSKADLTGAVKILSILLTKGQISCISYLQLIFSVKLKKVT